MPMTKLIKGLECLRCRHQWIPRDFKEKPIQCPACSSPYWNKPKKERKK